MALSQEIRLDDASVMALEKELNYQEARVVERKYPQYKFAEGSIIPLEYQEIPWAETHSYKQVTAVGEFQLIRDYTTSVPNMEMLTEEFIHGVTKWGAAYTFNEEEAYKAAHLGQPIEDQKIAIVRRGERQKLDQLIAFGNRATNTPGFLNHPNVLRSIAPYPLNATTATSDQLTTTLVHPVSSMVQITKGAETPDTVLLPIKQFEFLQNRRLDGAADATSVLTAFLKNNAHIKNIEPLWHLEGAGPNGEDVMVVYRRDIDAVRARITDSFKFRKIQEQPFGYQRPCAFKYGGIVMYYPYSVHLVIGV